MLSSLPHIFLFLNTLVFGTAMAISSSSWVLMWTGLELNLLSFIPLMSACNSRMKSEAIMKYFFVQAAASAIILMMMVLYALPKEAIISQSSAILGIITALLMKLGMVPCHWWFPSIITDLNWFTSLLLLTIQKIAPIFIILGLMEVTNQLFMSVLIATAAMVGGIGGLMQTSLKPILAYSSITHMAWILGANLVSYATSIVYLSIYLITVSSLIIFLMINKIEGSFSYMRKWKMLNPYKTIAMFILVLSMGGMPPFLGFLPKFMAFESLVTEKFYIVSAFLYIGALLNLAFYINIMIHLIIAPMGMKLKSLLINPIIIVLLMGSVSPILLIAYQWG